jgi:hypothetical protein
LLKSCKGSSELIREIIMIIKTNLSKLIGGLALVGAVTTVSAQPTITYTETGLLSGSLGGTGFAYATATVTTVGNAANIGFSLSSGVIPMHTLSGITTIQIDGFSLATFNGGDSFGVLSYDLNSFTPGTGFTGFLDITAMQGIFGNRNTSPSYDLSTSTTFTGSAVINGSTLSTDRGSLMITASSATATFTATVEAVPEPSTLALAVLAGAGLLLKLRRRGRSMRMSYFRRLQFAS